MIGFCHWKLGNRNLAQEALDTLTQLFEDPQYMDREIIHAAKELKSEIKGMKQIQGEEEGKEEEEEKEEDYETDSEQEMSDDQ